MHYVARQNKLETKKFDTILDFCVSSLRRGHATFGGSIVLEWKKKIKLSTKTEVLGWFGDRGERKGGFLL